MWRAVRRAGGQEGYYLGARLGIGTYAGGGRFWTGHLRGPLFARLSSPRVRILGHPVILEILYLFF